jgi:3-methylcrotonyl-CoA carboxylase alpha subunit
MPTYETPSGEVTFALRSKGDRRYEVEWPDGQPEELCASLVGGSQLVLSIGTRSITAHVARNEKGLEVFVGGRIYEFRHPSVERARGVEETPALAAPMPGVVVKVLVVEGQEVEAGQPAVVVEAMKMIHEICCGESGVVSAIHFKEGDQVDAGVPIVEIESEVKKHAE